MRPTSECGSNGGTLRRMDNVTAVSGIPPATSQDRGESCGEDPARYPGRNGSEPWSGGHPDGRSEDALADDPDRAHNRDTARQARRARQMRIAFTAVVPFSGDPSPPLRTDAAHRRDRTAAVRPLYVLTAKTRNEFVHGGRFQKQSHLVRQPKRLAIDSFCLSDRFHATTDRGGRCARKTGQKRVDLLEEGYEDRKDRMR